MKVNGVDITNEQMDDAIARVLSKKTFRKSDFDQALTFVGVPYVFPGSGFIADRASDRLLQRLRRNGHIRVSKANKRVWEVV